MQTAKTMKSRCRNSRGFTLLEIVAVLVILGILSAIVFATRTNTEADLFTATEALRSHLRYAQTQAMNKNTLLPPQNQILSWGIRCDGNQYWLFSGVNPAANIQTLPDTTAVANQGVSLAAKGMRANAFTVFFDERGIPYSAYTNATVNVRWTDNDNPIVVTDLNSGATRNITITPLTGFIP